ncbi:hypothetical protein ACFL2J_05900 [Candidatus Omnitrophota bacterium]
MLVKVEDDDNSEVFDESDYTFDIKGTLQLDLPNSNETWYVGTASDIQWTPTGTWDYIDIYYSKDNGSNWTIVPGGDDVPTGTTGEQQTFNTWAPGINDISGQYKIKINDADSRRETWVVDESTGISRIVGSIIVTGPTGTGIVWYKGETTREVAWTATGNIDPVKIDYSINGGSNWTEITASAPGGDGAKTYTWAEVADVKSETCRIRVSDPSFQTYTNDMSDNDFAIRPQLTVSQPVVDSDWKVGATTNIRINRTSTTVTNVDLEYSTNNGSDWTAVSGGTNLALTGTDTDFTWTIPDTISDQVKIKATDTGESNIFDESDGFRIIGFLTLTHPQGDAEKWEANSTTNNITWTKTGAGLTLVDLYYSTNSGSDWNSTPIATSVSAADLSHTWNPMPAGISSTARVKVVDSTDSTVFDASDDDFHIIGKFTITSPDGDSIFVAGNSHNIVWDKHDITGISDVLLEFSYNGGSDWNYVVPAGNHLVTNSGSYGWTVDGSTISGDCKIRITDPNESQATALSAGTFDIKGSLIVTSPNLGSEDWDIGDTYSITWSNTGAVSTIKILYSADSGSNYAQIPGATGIDASLGTWPWFIATDTVLSTDCRIKLEDSSDSEVYDESNSDFTVKGSVTLTAPSDTGIVMTYDGEAYPITWTRFGEVQNVELRYSTNNGSTYPVSNQITASVPGDDLGLSWTVPDKIMGNVIKVKIMDADNSAVFDVSDNPFEIIGSIELGRPNGGLTWKVTEGEAIQWTPHGTFDFVRIEYSIDDGSTWTGEPAAQVAAGSDGEQQSFNWSVDDIIGTGFRVRVSDYDRQSQVNDESTASNTVIGILDVTYPDGGDELVVEDEEIITWNATGAVDPVRVDFSTNAGGGWTNLTTTASGGYGSYSYTWPQVTDTISETCLVRVSDARFPATTTANTSAATFSVRSGIQVVEPKGSNDRWVIGGNGLIEWSHQGSIGNINIYYSTDGGSTYPYTIDTAVDGTDDQYQWQDIDDVLAFSSGKDMRIKLAKAGAESLVSAISDPFKVVGDIQITRPLVDEEIKIGGSYQVKWTMDGSIDTVQILYSYNGGTDYDDEVVASASAGDPAAENSYFWNSIDEAVFPPSTNAVLKVIDTADALVNDVSAVFKLQAQFDVIHPEVGEVLKIADSYTIEWDTTGDVSEVVISYSTDGGSTYPNTIYSQTADTESKSWTVPPVVSTQVRVKVADYNDSDAFGYSSGNFKIRGVITITDPDGGESWLAGDTQDIVWTKQGPIANVKIEYSIDGGSTYPGTLESNPIRTSVDATGDPADSYKVTWAIPDELSDSVIIRITDVLDTTVFDESDAVFDIKGKIVVDYPVSGDPADGVFDVGATERIQWTPTGTFDNVTVEYSTNNGTSYNAITGAESVTASQGYYDWGVYNAVSETAVIRVSNAGSEPVDAGVSDTIAIKPTLTLTSPDTDSFWEVDKDYDIVWTKTGTISTVKLEYSVDGGSSYESTAIASSVDATGDPEDSYKYTWTVLDIISDQVVIKITNNADSSVYDESEVFEVAGYLDLIAPDGGEAWIVDDQEAITWVEHGSISQVTLSYSINSGVDNYENAINSGNPITASNRTYPWDIPNEIGEDLKVKIVDNSGTASTTPDTSTNPFTIRGSLIITSPISTSDWEIATTNNITWERHGSITNASLEYSIDSGSTYGVTIESTVSADSSPYPWSIPADQSDIISDNARIKITNLADPTNVLDESADFTVRGRFTSSFPTQDYRWKVADTQWISWTTYGDDITQVVVEYSTDDGSNWSFVTTGAANNDQLSWEVPNEPGIITQEALIKVSDSNDPGTFVISPQFAIYGSLTITFPNGNEIFNINSSKDITWIPEGDMQTVLLEYTTNGGTDWTEIAASADAATGAYGWTPIPDTPSLDCLVRITDNSDPLVTDVSNAAFSIKGAFTIDYPNGSEDYTVYDATMNANTEEIRWWTDGSIDPVNLDYSIDSGSNWTSITTDYSNTGDDYTTYSWQVPNFIYDTVKVRVMDANDSNVKDSSNNDFNIIGMLIVDTPNGGEQWEVLTQEQIKWYSVGSIQLVQLYYKDSTGSYLLVDADPVANAAGLRTYNWNIPSTATINNTSSMIKVVDDNNANVWDESDDIFTIQASFNITAPSGGTWLAGNTERIIWTTGGTVDNVRLKYSTDSGSSFQSILGADPLDNSNGWFDWAIPAAAVSPNVIVRVEDELDSTAYDLSSQFLVRATLTLTSPQPGSVPDLEVNNAYNIRWDQTGVIKDTSGNTPRVKLEYSFTETFVGPILIDGGIVVPTEYQAGKWEYAWTIPDEIVDNIRETVWIRVSDPNDSSTKDVIGPFRVVPDIVVTSPDGDDMWYVGDTTHTVDYTITGTVPSVEISYSPLGGAGGSWVTIGTHTINTSGLGPHSESFSWGSVGGIPHINSNQVKLRVIDPRGTDTEGISAGDATIRPKFTLTSLTGGSEEVVDSGVPITWTNTGSVDNVLIEYSLDSGVNWSTIEENEGTQDDGQVDNITDQSYTWTIPDDIDYNVRVRVSNALEPDPSDPGAYSSSSNDFRIKGALAITNPTSVDSWDIGKGYAEDNDIDITWDTAGSIDEVDLFYSINNGSTFPYTIATSVTNTGSYQSWAVPDAQSGEAVIRVVDSYNTNCSDVLDDSEPFHVIGYLLLLSPNGDESWSVGETSDITWEWGGTLTQVTLSYSLDQGTSFPAGQVIGTVPNGSGAGGPGNIYPYTWTIPDKISGLVRVKVEAYNDDTVYDTSDANFDIVGALSVIAPANGDRWITNKIENIQWIPSGTMNEVTIKYSIDEGASYPYTIVSGLTNVASGQTGSYPWQVPGGGVDVAHAALEDHLVTEGELAGSFESGSPLNSVVRVYDAADSQAYGDSADFTIDYYNVDWEMRDLLTNQEMSDLTGVSTSGWEFANRSSPISTRTPYGQWDFVWSATGFGDELQNLDSFSDLTGDDKIMFFMETDVVHIWRSEVRYAYVPDTDTLNMTAWLERDGSLITGGVFWDTKIYSGTTLLKTMTHNTESWRLDCVLDPYSDPQTPSSSGVYGDTWIDTDLDSGQIYTLVTRIQIGTGGTITTPSTLEITVSSVLDEMESVLVAQLDVPLSQVRADIASEFEGQLEVIGGAMSSQTKAIQDKMSEFTQAANTLKGAAANSLISAGQLDAAAGVSQVAASDLQSIARRQSAKLLIPQAVVTGEPAKMRYRGYSTGLSPLIDILDFENSPIITAQPMIEIPGKPGLYEYEIAKIDADIYVPGVPFTVIVTDNFTGNVESGAVFVETALGQLLLPGTVLSGDKVILRFRGKGGWKPEITIVDYEGTTIVETTPMEELKGKEKEGYFSYTITKITGDEYVPGKPVTVTVHEPTTDTTESGTFMVESTSLSSLEGLVASGAGAKQVAQDALDSINAVRGSLATGGDVGMTLENIKYKLGRIPKEIASEGITAPIVNKVNEIKEQFIQFVGEEGYDFSTLLETGLVESVTVGDIRTTTDKISGASDLIGEIIEREFGGSDKPVIQLLFE